MILSFAAVQLYIDAMKYLARLLPRSTRETLLLRYFGLTKIPLLLYARPTVTERSDYHVTIKIRLRRKLMNHYHAMYFPVLAIGADCAAGLLAVTSIRRHGHDVSFIFKDFSAEFYRRATGDVFFRCEQAVEIDRLVQQAINSSERIEQTFTVTATVPAENNETVARFWLTLSLRRVS